MAEVKFPREVESAEWRKVVGALDTLKVGDAIARLEALHKDLPWHLFETAGLANAEQAKDRLDQAVGAGAKAAKALSDQARAVRAAIDKFVAANRKNAKAAAAIKHAERAARAAEEHGKAIVALSARSAMDIMGAIEKLSSDAKKAADKGKAGAAPNPKLVAHNSKVRSLVNKLRGGTQTRTLFAFLQCKVRQPFNKAKPWPKKSLLHVGPKAVKGCRSELQKLLEPEQSAGEFVFYFGEVELKGPKGKGKLVFEFESPLANPKQMKDALLYQCRYSPPMQLRKKNGDEVIEEDAEGDEKDAEGDDAAEEAAAPAKAGWQAARPTAVEDADIAKARTALVDSQVKLRNGIGDLMTRIAEVYQGAAGKDLDQVKTALRRLDALHKKLAVDVGAPMADVAKAKDASDRGKRKKAAHAIVTKLNTVVAGEELMDDIDRNELLPGLVVVAPLKDRLKRALDLLR